MSDKLTSFAGGGSLKMAQDYNIVVECGDGTREVIPTSASSPAMALHIATNVVLRDWTAEALKTIVAVRLWTPLKLRQARASGLIRGRK